MMKLLSAITALTLTACNSSDSPDEKRSIGCAILKDFVSREFATTQGPLALSDDPTPIIPPDAYQDIDGLVEAALSLEGNTKSRSELRHFFEEQEQLSQLSPTAECPRLAALKSEKSFVPPAGPKPRQTTEDGFFYTYRSLAVSVPLVDLNAGEATFEASRVCGPLCAGGVVVTYLRGENGKWRFASERGTWIS